MVDPIGTCQALDLLTQDQLEQLFDESNGYLSKVDEIFDTVQIAEMQQEEEEENENNNSSSSDSNDINEKKKKIHQHRRVSSKLITDKKCLILDVDNTLIYVRHFMDEMRVGDLVKLGDRDATVTKITYRLDLEFSENPGTMSAYDHVLQSKDDAIPQRGEWFPDELSKVAIIHQADPTGCVIKLAHHDDDDIDAAELDNANAATEEEPEHEHEEIDISFLQNSDELSQLEPMMSRENYISVTFMYGGYLVRIRPGLEKFLSLCNAKYDVILFTAADGSVYEGLLKQVHHILKQTLTEASDANNVDFIIPHKLWQSVYFRSDCDEKLDEYGLPYRHKNLAKLGRELSTIVMVDDNPLSYRGFEPNSVRVAGFWGLAQPTDNELMDTLFPTLWTIADHKDVRYHLSGLGAPPPDATNIPTNVMGVIAKNINDDGVIDLLTRQRRHSRQASAKFLQHLKDAIVAENESLEESTDGDDGEDNEDSSVVIEQTPNDSSNEEDDESLDSLSKSKGELEQENINKTNKQSKQSSQKPSEEKHNKNKLTHSELDEIFNNNKNANNNNNAHIHSRMTSHESNSGIGAGGALIFDNYDEDVLFRDAYDSPKATAKPTAPNFDKRPSIELDKPQDEARKTEPNSPQEDNDGSEDLSSPPKNMPPLDYNDGTGDDEQEEVHVENGDFVLSPEKNMSPTDSVSSHKRGPDTKLLHGSSSNVSTDSNSSAITGFIDIEMMHRQRKTGSRPEREIFDETDAEILIEKTSGCSCFGWFGKKKSKNIGLGLAQQELR